MIPDIWASYRRLPLGVQLWVGLWLAPINIATVLFISDRNGLWIFLLSIAGMAPNLPIMMHARGLTRLMALPHLIIWTPLMLLLAVTLLQGTTTTHEVFLVALLLTNGISLVFDAIDYQKWRHGDRAIA